MTPMHLPEAIHTSSFHQRPRHDDLHLVSNPDIAHHVTAARRKLGHHILKLVLSHLPMPDADSRFRHELLQLLRDDANAPDAVMDKEHLAAAVDLAEVDLGAVTEPDRGREAEGVLLVEKAGEMLWQDAADFDFRLAQGYLGPLPATYAIDGVRKGLIEGAAPSAVFADMWPLVVMGIVFIPVGLWAFGRAERYAKRTGKLKRVG